jgi:hypothetical protein
MWKHSMTANLGENLAAFYPAGQPASRPVQGWADERQWYDYASNTCNAPAGRDCGHYTQIVWRSSARVGCAVVVCDQGTPFMNPPSPTWEFWVCQYSPPGNIIGQRPY